ARAPRPGVRSVPPAAAPHARTDGVTTRAGAAGPLRSCPHPLLPSPFGSSPPGPFSLRVLTPCFPLPLGPHPLVPSPFGSSPPGSLSLRVLTPCPPLPSGEGERGVGTWFPLSASRRGGQGVRTKFPIAERRSGGENEGQSRRTDSMRMPVTGRRFTVEEYHRMGRAGVFREDDRVELLDGQIVEMTPIGPGHAGCVAALTGLLARLVGDRAVLWVQNPVLLG